MRNQDGKFALFASDRKLFAGFFVLLGAFLAVQPALAADQPYVAKEMIRSARIVEMAAGGSASFTVGFKNTGSTTWTREGRNFASVYTYGPKYRKSAFVDPSWMSETQPARMKEESAPPGTIGRFTFTLSAPKEPGTYKETFHLAAENLVWIPGGSFTVEIVVSGKSAQGGGPSNAAGYKAQMMTVSERSLALDVGGVREFRVAFKNIGRKSWMRYGPEQMSLRLDPLMPAFFRNASWTNGIAAALPAEEIKPGELALFSFSVKAPSSTGTFAPKFSLAIGNEFVEGGEVEIPMEVRTGAVPSSIPAPAPPPIPSSGNVAAVGNRGPNMRIGLFSTTKPLVLAADGAYALYDGDDNKVKELSGVTTTTFDLASRTYTVTNGSFSFTGRKFVRFTPLDPASTIFEIKNYENIPTWDATVNFNRFRGSIEYYYVVSTATLWVTEELPLEDYMRGLAETSNGSPYEFQKALVTAARTYALFVHSIGGKHKKDFFHLNTTGNDQVYKGYVSELIRTNVVRAVEETRGKVVTHGGELVVTPYFSRSDGRTRAWTEVWGGSTRPWLVSKVAPYDQGQTLWGHGVGMSANDAVRRAEHGASWTDILQYYYTGIELRSFY